MALSRQTGQARGRLTGGRIADHAGPKELWVGWMDHVFNAFATDERLEAMIAATIAHFDAHLD